MNEVRFLLDFRFEADKFVIVVTMQLGMNLAFVICSKPRKIIQMFTFVYKTV